VSRRESGMSLLELLTVIAIIGMILAVTIPAFGNIRRKMAIRAAAAELRTFFHLARSRAIARSTNCGLKFYQENGQWLIAMHDDGDRDGVRNDDINSGKDRRVRAPRGVLPPSSVVQIGLLDYAIKDPDGDLLPPSKSPVAFNKSAICSFSPMGEATPGTIYLTDSGRDLWAVRILGSTARVRMLRYDRQKARWVQ
jgi:prepilin-type N-terminal cleavage/methylation domain-containing protein